MQTNNATEFRPNGEPEAILGASIPEDGSRRGIRRVLYAEDEPMVRSITARLLAQAGYKVVAVGDGLAAWEAITASDFDVLITDNDMPHVTGIELVMGLRRNGFETPIILASGSADFFSGEEFQWMQFSACLQKPFAPRQLLETVARVLG